MKPLRSMILHALRTAILLYLITFAMQAQSVQKMVGVSSMPEKIDFKLIKPGKTGAQLVMIMNNTPKQVVIKNGKKIKAPYTVEPASFPRKIEGKKDVKYKLIYKPTKPGDYTGPIGLIVSSTGELVIIPKQ